VFSILQEQAQGALSSLLPSVCPYLGLAPTAGRSQVFPLLLVVEVHTSRLLVHNYQVPTKPHSFYTTQEGTVHTARLICILQPTRGIGALPLTLAAQKYNPRPSCIYLKHSRSDIDFAEPRLAQYDLIDLATFSPCRSNTSITSHCRSIPILSLPSRDSLLEANCCHSLMQLQR